MSSKRVLFFTPYGSYRVHNQVDAILAAALRERQCEVQLVACDGIYKKCEVLTWSKDLAEEHCRQCAADCHKFSSTFALPLVQLRAYLTPTDFQLAENWAAQLDPETYPVAHYENSGVSLPIGIWATSSVFSYFRITTSGLSRPDVRAVHKQYLINALLTYWAMSRIVDEFRPTNMVVFNARIAPHRVVFELAKMRGIEVITHERGYSDDSFMFFSKARCDQIAPILECANIWENVPLSTEQLQEVKQYYINRENGKDLNHPAFFDFLPEYNKVRHHLQIPPRARILGVFTTSEFEQAYSEDFRNVTNQIEMIDRLIAIFRKRDDYLVIRHHPYIGGFGLFPPDLSFLSRAYAQAMSAPPNVRIIMPSEKISSYSIIPNLSAAIVPFSTIGLEIAARGIAVASYEESIYHKAFPTRLGDTTTETLEKVVDELFRRTEHYSFDDFRMSYRLMHIFASKISLKLAACGIHNNWEANVRINSTDELKEGIDPILDQVCDHMMKGTSIFGDPTSSERSRSNQEEDEFFKKELEECKTRRAMVAKRSVWVSNGRLKPQVAIITLTPEGEVQRSEKWVSHTRYKNLSFYNCAVAKQAGANSIASLIAQLLKEMNHPYVLVAPTGFLYDESVIGSAVDMLLDDTECKFAAIRFGAWVHKDERFTIDQVFTKNSAALTFEALLSKLSSLAQFPALLGYNVFRRNALLTIIEQIAQAGSSEQLHQALYSFLSGDYICKAESPMILAPAPQLQEGQHV